MASYTILRAVGSDATYNLNKIDEAQVLPVASPTKKGDVARAEYTIKDGDSLHPTTITVTCKDDKTTFGGAGARTVTVQIGTWLVYTDDAGVVAYAPVNSFIGLNLAQSVPFEAADLLQLLEANLGIIAGSVTGGEPAVTRMTKLVFGVTGIF